MAIRIDRGSIEGCLSKVNSGIETLETAAKSIDAAMGELPNYWEGLAYNKARATYEEQYQTLLKTTVPQAVQGLKEYMNKCMETIVEIDQQLSGG